jgi:Ca2+-binding RTX toxin-like protein
VRASLAAPATNTGQAAGDSYTSVENLTGSRFADTLIGNGLANRLTGAGGPDVLEGGDRADWFVLDSSRDSPPAPAARDRIVGFNAGTAATFVDRIDVSAIDGRPGPGNQAFAFIGTKPFTRVFIGPAPFGSAKGQLRARLSGSDTIVEGDVNGDTVADFQIELSDFTALSNLTAIDFKL